MRRKKSSSILYQLMFAGCLGLSVSAPVTADFSRPQIYWSAEKISQIRPFSEYRFRPLQPGNARLSGTYRPTTARAGGFPGFAYPAGRMLPSSAQTAYRTFPTRFSGNSFPVARYAPARLMSYGVAYRGAGQADALIRSRPVARWSGRHAPQNTVPAFARQFAWTPAQPRGFIRGGSTNHYANQANTSQEHKHELDYRQAPVSSQGYRYRALVRNANYVTFSEKVKNPHQANRGRHTVQRFQQVLPVKPPQYTATNTPARIKPAPFLNTTIPSAEDYRFRPDLRFVQRQHAANWPVVAVPVPVGSALHMPSSYQLADAEVSKKGDNPWNEWSFRPVGPTF